MEIPFHLKQRRLTDDAMRRQRIAVIGAGAAGLSAAHYLRKKGYRRITILDRRPRVGGKCLTRVIDGRTYELGALVVGRCYRRVRQLIRAAGLTTVSFDPIRLLDLHRPQRSLRADQQFFRCPAFCKGRLLSAYLRHSPRLMRPGFRGLEKTPLAGMTMDSWLRRRRLDPLRSALKPYYVSWGYGYLEEMNALYVFKLLDLYVRALGRIHLHPRRDYPMGFLLEGYQRLWERIATPFELQLGVDIRSVERMPNRHGRTMARVAYDQTVRDFDALVIACPFDRARSFLDADPRERRLMKKVRTLDFYTLTAAVQGLPPDALVFVGNNLNASQAGRVVSWYRRWSDSNITVFYLLGQADLTTDHCLVRLEQDLAGLGAVVRKIHAWDHWHYFPHVSTADMAAGFYADVERLQGFRQTWYAGELMAFPTVEHVVAYSRRLVEEHF